MVAFRDLVESREFQDAKAALPVAWARTSRGARWSPTSRRCRTCSSPGATGAGKSVCVNTIITSLVYRHTPATLRFLMVDPKMVELSVYNDLPHMRHKVITDSKDAASVLKWAIMEMEERYALLAENGCRNLQDFNRRVRQHAQGEGPPLKAKVPSDTGFLYNEYTKGELPYVVVVIDEMADLMMTVQGEIETPIARLAQKARAIGIHLIIATQRPSVNVITGLIKANFPSRIAFRVASGVDSKTILDGVGRGGAARQRRPALHPAGKSEPSRLQGAYLSSEETERLMAWYRDRKEGTSADGRALAAGVDARLAARPPRRTSSRWSSAARRSRRARAGTTTRPTRATGTSCSSTPPRCVSSTRAGRRRSSSAGSRSGTGARRASSTSSTWPACSARPTARSRAT
jgi:S-DNA-T family DNA segregation ATPase FtsK/SpoIIIE